MANMNRKPCQRRRHIFCQQKYFYVQCQCEQKTHWRWQSCLCDAKHLFIELKMYGWMQLTHILWYFFLLRILLLFWFFEWQYNSTKIKSIEFEINLAFEFHWKIEIEIEPLNILVAPFGRQLGSRDKKKIPNSIDWTIFRCFLWNAFVLVKQSHWWRRRCGSVGSLPAIIDNTKFKYRMRNGE